MSLGAESVRCLDQRDQQRRSDRTDPRNLAKQFPRLVLLTFHHQIPSYLLAQGPQSIQLLVVVFGASPHTSFADLAEPFRTVTWCIHFVAGTRNAPTAIQRFEPIHDPREILGDGQITAPQPLHPSQPLLSAFYRLQL